MPCCQRHPPPGSSRGPGEGRDCAGAPGPDCGRRGGAKRQGPLPTSPRPGHRRPPLPGLCPLLHLAPLLHFPVPSASRVVVARSGSNSGKRRRRRRRGCPGQGAHPAPPPPRRRCCCWSGGAARPPFPVSPPSAIVRFASRTSRGPPQPGGDCRGGRDDSAGAGRGLREERDAGTGAGCGKRAREEPGVRRRPRWSGARPWSVRSPPVLHAAPPPPRGPVGEVRRAAAGAAAVARERKRARRQVRTPSPLPPPSRTPPGSASRFLCRPHTLHRGCARACAHSWAPAPSPLHIPCPPAPLPAPAPSSHPSPQGHYGDARERFVFNACRYSEERKKK